MGFSVTAAHVIFGIALLAAGSAATSAYWENQTHIEESRRALMDRSIEAARTNLTISNWEWDAEASAFSFTITNKGTTVLDHTKLTYVIDGAITFASQAPGFPELNDVSPPASGFFMAGDALDCRFILSTEPSALHVATENGMTFHGAG